MTTAFDYAVAGLPDLRTYAEYIVGLIRADLAESSIMREALHAGDIVCFTDLHAYVDANEYLIGADEHFELAVEDADMHTDYHDEVVMLVEHLMGWL